LAVLVQGAAGLRRGKKADAAGAVPIINYRYRHLQVAAAGVDADTFDWKVFLARIFGYYSEHVPHWHLLGCACARLCWLATG